VETGPSRLGAEEQDEHARRATAAARPTAGANARYILGTLSLVMLSTLLALVLWAAIPAIAPGWTQFTLSSDSMRPSMERGDIVLTAPVPGASLGPADVVAFTDPARGDHIVHRIVERRDDGTFVTRGDANLVADSSPLDPDRIAGVGRILVPLVGFPAVWMVEGRTGLVGGVVAIVLLLGWGSRFALLDRYDPWLSHGEATVRARPRGRSGTVGAVTSSVLVMLAGPALGAFVAYAGAGASWATGYWLETPENLRVTSTTSAWVVLEWDAVPRTDEYVVEWGAHGDEGEPQQVSTNETTLTIDELAAETTYEFRVRAQNDNAESDWSGVVTQTTDAITYVVSGSADHTGRRIDSLDGTGSIVSDDLGVPIRAMEMDDQGNIYLTLGARVVKVDRDGEPIWLSAAYETMHSVAVDGQGSVYAASSGRVRKLHPATGAEVDDFNVGPGGHAIHGLAVDAEGSLYTGSTHGRVRKLSSTGVELWVYNANQGAVSSVAVDTEGQVYAAYANGGVHRISPAGSGAPFYAGHGTAPVNAVAVDAAGDVYTASGDASVHRVSPAGTTRWTYEGHSGAVNGVAVDATGDVYTASSDHEVHKVDAAGGNVWVHEGHTDAVLTVAVDPGTFTVAGHVSGVTGSAFSTTGSHASLKEAQDAEDPEDTDGADGGSPFEESLDTHEVSVVHDLDPPGDLTVGETTATSVELTWSPVDGAEHYEVRWLIEERDTWSEGPTTGGTSVVVEGLDPATDHELQVRARDGEATSGWSASTMATTETASEHEDVVEGGDPTEAGEPLAAPDGLIVVDADSTAVELAWDLVDGAEGYEVAWRAEEQDTRSEGVTARTSWTVDELEPETTYELWVRAFDAEATGPWSTSVTATTERLTAVTEVVVTGVSPATVDLTWDVVAAADGYRLRWREDGATTWTEGGPTGTTSITVDGLEPATSYELEVRAERGAAVSDWSAAVTAVTADGGGSSDDPGAGEPLVAATDRRQYPRRATCRR
jgi:signal peptidase I